MQEGPLSGRRIAVTGATGFVGRALVRALLERGATPVGVVRNPDRVPDLSAQGVELRKADLGDEQALTAAFEGVDAAFSNAALISYGMHSKQTLIDTNMGGTRNVMRALHAAGVKRVVMTSSASAYKPRKDVTYDETHPLREATDRVTRIDYYAVSKACAEREAWRLADELDLELTTFRPHQIHGPFDDSTFTRWMRRFMVPPVSFFPTHVYMPSIYVGDLADVMCRALERDVAIGRAYNAAAPPDEVTYWKLMRAFGEAGGKTSHLIFPLPVPIARRYDLTRVKRDLDLQNRSLVDGFRETLQLEAAASHPQA